MKSFANKGNDKWLVVRMAVLVEDISVLIKATII